MCSVREERSCVPPRDLVAGAGDLVAGVVDLADHGGQGVLHVCKRPQQLARLVLAGADHRRGEVAPRDGARHCHGIAQWPGDAARDDHRQHHAQAAGDRAERDQPVARLVVRGLDGRGRLIQRLALHFHQGFHPRHVLFGGGGEAGFQQGVGLLGLAFAPQADHFVPRRGVLAAQGADFLEQSALRVGLHEAFDLFLDAGRGAGRQLLLLGKVGGQRGIAALGNGRGAAHGGVDQAIPVGDEALFGQRLLDHRLGGGGRSLQLPYPEQRAQQREGQQQAKTQGQAFSNGDLIHTSKLFQRAAKGIQALRSAA